MADEHKLSEKLHHLGEQANDALKEAAERIGEAPAKAGERTLAAAKAGEKMVEHLTEKAPEHKDDAEH